MKRLRFTHLVPGALLVAALGMAGCEVEKTEEGELPDVSVEGGKLPEYDVKGPDVDVNMEERRVTVPDVDVDVNSEERTITVPDVDINTPADDDAGQGDVEMDHSGEHELMDGDAQPDTPAESDVPAG
ncbi:MAG: hypothetical protein RBS88_01065 [Spongiibacteraceae bacterium]|jgi:hypothetical protein|nr:hypothetical protein [Spongiibacteraceae bacterium]